MAWQKRLSNISNMKNGKQRKKRHNSANIKASGENNGKCSAHRRLVARVNSSKAGRQHIRQHQQNGVAACNMAACVMGATAHGERRKSIENERKAAAWRKKKKRAASAKKRRKGVI